MRRRTVAARVLALAQVEISEHGAMQRTAAMDTTAIIRRPGAAWAPTGIWTLQWWPLRENMRR